MSGLVAEVAAQLNAAIQRLDTLAVTATHAQEEIGQSHRRFAEISQGTDHQDCREAVTQSRTAADKAGRLGRLTSNAAGHLAAYANAIAPGAVPTAPVRHRPRASVWLLRRRIEAAERRHSFDATSRRQIRQKVTFRTPRRQRQRGSVNSSSRRRAAPAAPQRPPPSQSPLHRQIDHIWSTQSPR